MIKEVKEKDAEEEKRMQLFRDNKLKELNERMDIQRSKRQRAKNYKDAEEKEEREMLAEKLQEYEEKIDHITHNRM